MRKLTLVKGETRRRGVPSADALTREVTRARVDRIKKLQQLLGLPRHIATPIRMRLTDADLDDAVVNGFDMRLSTVQWSSFQRRVRKYIRSLRRS